MSYQVLARKWRPGNFREMVGQEHVLRALINALDHNRLHHAYLFTGTRGVGKTTIARILAKCLNCEAGVTSTPCGECSSCVEIAEGRFVDLIEVDAASRTKVEDTRELLDNVQYAPTRGRYKIYLIDEVHMLSNHSFNALLKTLEEPPEHVKFLLATTDPQKLPITILSRCLQFNLKNMSPERIVGHLQNVLEKEAVPFEEPALWALARAADGSMRDGLSLTDQAISFGNGKVAESDVSAMLGTIDHHLIQKLVASLANSDAASILEAVAQFAEHAPDFDAALADLLTVLHRIAIAQALPEALDNSFGDRSEILDFAQRLTPEDVQLFYQTALIGRRDLALASDARSGFEMTLLRMLAFRPQGLLDVPQNTLPVAGASASSGKESAPLGEGPPPEKKCETEAVSHPESTASVRPPAARDLMAETAANEPALPKAVVAEVPKAVVAEVPKPQAVAAQLREQLKEITGSEGFSKTRDMSSRTAESQRLEPDVDAPGVSEARREISPAIAGQTIPLENLSADNWVHVFRTANIRGIMQSTAANCALLTRETNQLFFALDESRGSLFDSSHAQRLADLLSDYFGERVKVDINVQTLPAGVETPAQITEREKQEQHNDALQRLAEDPVVQTLQQSFGATLDESSVTILENE
ncbi:DNA polymerase-3 subunit gamma/tau [Alteromonadaceae bacterium 2753L.S.0a.02]|nr:DNA polymerase-3 subunit gamma/tau [Alteromonadaceae bacterium 2753L.S.0a.02]